MYTVVVSDANGCILSDTTLVGQPSAPLSATFVVDSVDCKSTNTGSVLVNVSGGTAGYNYRWSNGSTAQSINNMYAGRYTVRITDDHLCELTDSADLFEPDLLQAVLSPSDVLCHGGSSGAVDVLVFGGTPTYSYTWSNGSISGNISNLVLGTYSVTVTDVHNCVFVDSATVKEPIASLSSSVLSSAVKCYGGNDGSLDLSVGGGTLPYTYQWSNGMTTEDINSLPTGDYDVLIVDFNLCTHRDTGFVDQPMAPLSGIMNMDAVKCFGGNDGRAEVVVSGGTSPYGYLWSDGKVSAAITDKQTGTYQVTVTDANNCVWVQSALISQPAAPLSSTISVSDVLCHGGNDGSLNLTVSGGTSPYSYVWSNGGNTEDIGSLITGSYDVLITDANNCVHRDTGFVDEPVAALSSSFAVNTVSCHGLSDGAVQLAVSGGTAPYGYQWSNGSVSRDLINLPAGRYIVEITDANACKLSDTVEVSEPDLLTTSTLGTSATSDGENGSAWTLAVGGTLPYSYLWSDPLAQQTDTARNLIIGGYTVVVTDANGCTVRDSIWIPLAPDPSTIGLHPNPTNGEITITNLDALGLDEPILIEVVQPNGVIEQSFEILGWSEYTFTLDNNLFNGFFFIRISNFRGTEFRKLVLIR